MEIEKTLQSIREAVARAVVGKGEAVDLILTALLCGGHVLIEDVPGVGKTTLVRALAAALGLSFRRIQFTPDLTPSDVTGFTLVDLRTGETRRVEGAVMRQLILADEINRTGPRRSPRCWRSCRRGRSRSMARRSRCQGPSSCWPRRTPWALPAPIRCRRRSWDRFLFCVHMGYPAPGEEVRILDLARGGTRPEDLPAVTSAQEILEMQRRCREVKTAEAVKQYVVRIAEETRRDRSVSLGASPRASLMLLTASMAWALLHGRDYVLPDDVQRLAVPVLAHRIRLKAQAGYQQKSAGGRRARHRGQPARAHRAVRAVRAGWFAVLGLSLLGGLASGLRAYYLVFFSMLFLTLCCAAMTLWTYFSFSYLQAAERAVAVRGETVSLRVGIYNDKPYPFTRMRVEVACADPAQRIALALDLAPRRDKQFDLALRLPYCGVYQVGMTRLSVCDCFGLLPLRFDLRNLPYYRMAELTVLPELTPLPPPRQASFDAAAFARGGVSDAGDSFAMVRPYAPGDPLRSVHWKLSARRGEPLVRQYDVPEERTCCIAVDARPLPGAEGEDALRYADAAASCALALADQALRAGHPVRLTDGRDEVLALTEREEEAVRLFLARLRFDAKDSPEGRAHGPGAGGRVRPAVRGVRPCGRGDTARDAGPGPGALRARVPGRPRAGGVHPALLRRAHRAGPGRRDGRGSAMRQWRGRADPTCLLDALTAALLSAGGICLALFLAGQAQSLGVCLALAAGQALLCLAAGRRWWVLPALALGAGAAFGLWTLQAGWEPRARGPGARLGVDCGGPARGRGPGAFAPARARAVHAAGDAGLLRPGAALAARGPSRALRAGAGPCGLPCGPARGRGRAALRAGRAMLCLPRAMASLGRTACPGATARPWPCRWPAACLAGAFFFVPREDGAWRSEPVRAVFSDVEDFYNYYIGGAAGGSARGRAELNPLGTRLGGDLHLTDEPVLRVRSDDPFPLLTGAIEDTYNGSQWYQAGATAGSGSTACSGAGGARPCT